MTTATQTQTAAQFRKGQHGQWVVYGPAAVVVVGRVPVAKRSGEVTTATVTRVVAAQTAGMAWGELATVTRKAAPRAGRAWRPCGYPGCSPQHCDDCG